MLDGYSLAQSVIVDGDDFKPTVFHIFISNKICSSNFTCRLPSIIFC
jgi:hypothetical protein